MGVDPTAVPLSSSQRVSHPIAYCKIKRGFSLLVIDQSIGAMLDENIDDGRVIKFGRDH